MRSSDLARHLAARAADVAAYLFPNGKRSGAEFKVGSIHGEAGNSLSIRLTGSKAGQWADFGSDDIKGDLFGLWKKSRDLSDKDAAREIEEFLGVQSPIPTPITPPARVIVPTDTPPKSIAHAKHGKPVRLTDFRNAAGQLLGYECRFEDGEGKKTFAPYTHGSDGWQWAAFPRPLPLFQFPELLARPNATVVVCEGAKAAVAAQVLLPQCVAVTWPQGANSAGNVDWSVLRGRKVILWPDADTPGRKAMEVVAAAINEPLRMLDVSDMPDKWDAADFNASQTGDFTVWAKAHIRDWAPQPKVVDAPKTAPALGVVESDGSVRKVEAAPAPEWFDALIRTKEGSPKALLANAIHALRHAPQWAGVLGYDQFAQRTALVAQAPFGAPAGAWTDTMDVLTADWLQHAGIGVNSMIAAQAVEAVARENPFHPVTAYLSSLRWDGVQRVGSWLSDYLGAESTPYTRAAGQAWLISAVARIRSPGCKADMALILEGDQGAMKSTAFDVLGGQWFTDDIEKLGTKDASMQAMAAWIIEMAELDAMTRKVEISGVKAFLSRRTDRFRLPYGKRIVEAPRQCVFCGTVNPGGSGYLHDETGNRRFLPVTVGVIDIDFLRRERDQIWAEADHLYRSGEKWWFTDADVIEAARQEQSARREHDVWEGALQEYFEQHPGTDFVTMTAMLADVLKVPIERQTKLDQRRAGGCLRQLGWEPGAQRYGSSTTRGWRKKKAAVQKRLL